MEVMKKVANIRAFHEKQLRNSWFDPKTGRDDPRHEDSAHRDCRRLCASGRLRSLQRTDERASGKVAGTWSAIIMTTPRSRRKGQSWYIGLLHISPVWMRSTRSAAHEAIAAMAFGTQSIEGR